MTKLVQSRWLNIGLVLFGLLIDIDFASVHKNVKKNLANIQLLIRLNHAWSITHTYKMAQAFESVDRINTIKLLYGTTTITNNYYATTKKMKFGIKKKLFMLLLGEKTN